jgi:hypothetical protein
MADDDSPEVDAYGNGVGGVSGGVSRVLLAKFLRVWGKQVA